MTKETTKLVSKKAATAPSSGKPKVAKAAVATAAKSPVAKKPAAKKAAGKITAAATTALKTAKTPAVKKEPIPAEQKKVSVLKAKDALAKLVTLKKMAAQPTPEERYRMVETAAYFIAEQNCFQGRADEHWVAAERKIAAMLNDLPDARR